MFHCLKNFLYFNNNFQVSNDWKCPVCFLPSFDSNCNDLVRTIPCRHIFHKKCLQKWLHYRFIKNCILCRQHMSKIQLQNTKMKLQNFYDNFSHSISRNKYIWVHLRYKNIKEDFFIHYKTPSYVYKLLQNILSRQHTFLSKYQIVEILYLICFTEVPIDHKNKIRLSSYANIGFFVISYNFNGKVATSSEIIFIHAKKALICSALFSVILIPLIAG